MSVRLEGGVIYLEGLCRLEDAEVLAALLMNAAAPEVDLSGCEGLHGAVVQALIAFVPRLTGMPTNTFIRDWLLPTLMAATKGGNEQPERNS